MKGSTKVKRLEVRNDVLNLSSNSDVQCNPSIREKACSVHDQSTVDFTKNDDISLPPISDAAAQRYEMMIKKIPLYMQMCFHWVITETLDVKLPLSQRTSV